LHGLVVAKDSALRTLADFKGHSIGVPFGSDSHVDLLVALKAVGLDPVRDVSLQNLAPNEQGAAFQQHLVDAVVVRPPLLEKLKNDLGGREIQSWPHHLWVIARADYLRENAEVEERLLTAIREAVLYINAHPAETAAWFAEDLRQKPDAVAAAAKLNPLFDLGNASIPSLKPSPELKAFAEKRADELVAVGLTKHRVEFFAP
jgi:ABC-type nitrate/sulfonate/bicarbonate transport system substrate-binding protein